jgi:hypothetical protein
MAELEEDLEKAAAAFSQSLESERELGEQRLTQVVGEERAKTEALAVQVARETAAREALEQQIEQLRAQAQRAGWSSIIATKAARSSSIS